MKGKVQGAVLGSPSVFVAIQEPPMCNSSLDSGHGYLALTTPAIFAPGGCIQLAKGNCDNFEAGQHDNYHGPRHETHKESLWQGTASISEFGNADPQLKDTGMPHYTSGEKRRHVNRRACKMPSKTPQNYPAAKQFKEENN